MKPVLIMKFPYASRFGGGEKHTLTLVDALKERGVPTYFIGSCSVLRRELRQRHVPVLPWSVGKEPVKIWSLVLFPLTAVWAFVSLTLLLVWYRVFARVGTLYCLSLTEKVVITPVARLLGMKVLWVEHVTFERWLSQNPLRFLYAAWGRLAHIVAISDIVRRQLRALGVPARSITVVHNGIDLAPYAQYHRQAFHWTRKFIIGMIARLDAEKGIAYLLRAFHDLLPLLPHARLIIVGDGPERRELEWLARRLGVAEKVQWVGFQENVSEWVKSFDCFVLPSVGRESFGIVLLEALASGCPVIASNLGGIPEVIENGRTGILVEPGDAGFLMSALLYVYRHPDVAMKLGSQGRARVHAHFSLQAKLEELLDLFP